MLMIEKFFMKSAGRRGYSPLARVMTLAVMLLAMAATAWAQETKYTVTMAEGTVDAANWTIEPTEAAEGKPITATYSGTKHVKSVTAVTKAAAPAVTVVDLSKLTADYEAKDGETLTGTLGGNYKITIADKATVTLDGVTINGVNNSSYKWAGLTCAGDATIILKEGTTNTVKGFYENYPGILVPSGKTVTIKGDGSLTASPFDGGTNNSYGAGIGGGFKIACGNITIAGGTITATGGFYTAGIGGGQNSSCGDISISGGTINATGGNSAAGIGCGYASTKNTASCGNITIANTVTKVTATKGNGAANSIGKGKAGYNATNTCGTVTIGGTVYENGISDSPYTYPSN